MFDGENALAGDNQDDRKAIINDLDSFDNTLVMKSRLKHWDFNGTMINT